MGVALLVIVVAGACGEGGTPADPGSGNEDTTTTAAAGGRFSTTPVSVAGQQRGLLAGVTAEAAGDHERVTFTFEGPLPGYRVEYTQRPLVEDGSGDEVAVDGDAVLSVHFEPASGADLSGDQLRMTYTGPRRIRADLAVVREVVRVTDFEANLDWAIGLVGEVPFRVQTLRGPPRVVVDFQAPAP